MTILMCSLIQAAPYYDCPPEYDGVSDGSGKLWTINVYDNYYRKNIPTFASDSTAKSGLDGYADWKYGMANVVEAGLQEKDTCGRTILLHELLHLKYKNIESVHLNCITW